MTPLLAVPALGREEGERQKVVAVLSAQDQQAPSTPALLSSAWELQGLRESLQLELDKRLENIVQLVLE